MDPLTIGALGGAAISGIGSLIGGSEGDKRARREAKKQRSFQERMRNTQWQAAVSDMEAAGINPAIAYSKGPAAAPSGAMAQQKDVISPAISSAMQMKRLQADIKNIQTQNLKLAQETVTSGASAQFIQEQTRQAAAQTDLARLTLAAHGFQYPAAGRKGQYTTLQQPTRDPTLIRQKMQAEIQNLRARSGQTSMLTRVGEPVAQLMDDMGIWGPIAAGLGRIMGPGFTKRVQIPKFRGRKLKLPKFRIPIKWGGGR